jgi:hypothetical protein
MTTLITDFSRSFIRWRIDTLKKAVLTVSQPLPMTLNNVRAPVEARAVIAQSSSGKNYEYVLSAACKTEQVWVMRDMWHQPNADMCMIAGRDECLIEKQWDVANKVIMRHPPHLGQQPERQIEDPANSFDHFGIEMTRVPARELTTIDEILQAFASARSVVAQTTIQWADYDVLLEYPVKVVNFSERERYYQVDTGPILLPLLYEKHTSPIETCRRAFVAHNSTRGAEFIVNMPTPIASDIAVHHYSHVVRIDEAENVLLGLI